MDNLWPDIFQNTDDSESLTEDYDTIRVEPSLEYV